MLHKDAIDWEIEVKEWNRDMVTGIGNFMDSVIGR